MEKLEEIIKEIESNKKIKDGIKELVETYRDRIVMLKEAQPMNNDNPLSHACIKWTEIRTYSTVIADLTDIIEGAEE